MTRLYQITGSKAHRVWRCPPSIVLPQVDSPTPPEVDLARTHGKVIHRYVERCGTVGAAEALAEVPDEVLPLVKALDLDELPIHLATEVSYAYDWRARTARELGRNLDRAYTIPGYLASIGVAELGPTEIALTIDLAGGQVIDGGRRRGYAGDYKSGHTKYPPPNEFAQTLLAAQCMRLLHDFDDVIVELIHVHRGGTHHKVRRFVDGWDLDTFADDFEAAMELVDYSAAELAAGRGVPVREGPHCQHCDAFQNCPAKVALVRSIPAELASIGVALSDRPEAKPGELMIQRGAITVERAAEVWTLLERISEVIDRAKEEICGLASRNGDIPLPDGRVIGRIYTERESLDGKVAAAVLEQWYGPEAVAEAVELSMSKDALRKAVVARKKPGEKIETKREDGVFDKIMAEIRARKGVGINSTDTVKPHMPRRLKRGS